MNRTLLVAAAWGLAVWNLVGLAAFIVRVDAGTLGVIVGLVVTAAIALARVSRARTVRPSQTTRTRAQA